MTTADTLRAAVEALERDIMNLPVGRPGWAGNDLLLYKEGHRDARHAAVELVSSALSLLRSALEQSACPQCHGTGQIRRVGSTPMGRPVMEVDACPACSALASIPPNTPVEAGKVGVADGVPAVQAPSLTERLQQKCSDWGTYWRAPDAHGVVLTHEQALDLLRDALGVEVEFQAASGVPEGARDPADRAVAGTVTELCPDCDGWGGDCARCGGGGLIPRGVMASDGSKP